MPSKDAGGSFRFDSQRSPTDRVGALPGAVFDKPARSFEEVAVNASDFRRETHEAETLAPGPLGQQAIDLKYEYYKSLIHRNNGKFDEAAGMKNLVAIRHETSTGANGGKGLYDDTAVLLWVDGNGQKHVSQYRANTDPTAHYLADSSALMDANGDGLKELGRLPAGSYSYFHTWFQNKYETVGDGNVFKMPEGLKSGAQYDTNHDGRFGENAWSDGGESMFWHSGRNEGDVASAGCQTMPPDEWNRFIDDMNVSVVDKYNPLSDPVSLRYTLVDEDSSKGNVPYGHREVGPVSSALQSSTGPGTDPLGLNLPSASSLAFAAEKVNHFLAAAANNTFAAGGDVQGPGSSIGDKIPAYLSDGEFVMNARSTTVNRPFLQALNADPYFLQKMLEQRSAQPSGGRGYGPGASSGQPATVNISMSSQDDVVARLKVLAQQWELMHTN